MYMQADKNVEVKKEETKEEKNEEKTEEKKEEATKEDVKGPHKDAAAVVRRLANARRRTQ